MPAGATPYGLLGVVLFGTLYTCVICLGLGHGTLFHLGAAPRLCRGGDQVHFFSHALLSSLFIIPATDL